MAKDVILTPLAVRTYENIIEYLLSNWGVTAANNFIDRFEELSNHLTMTPEIFPFTDKNKRVRRCVLTKHNVLYFKETALSIKILVIFDTRQNPEKLAYLL